MDLKRDICFKGISQFDFMIKYNETERKSHTHEIDMHTHKLFEIYINLSGDVSFLVENNLYPVTRGDVIISRPNEQHHCVYNSDSPHKLFWILFDIEKNREILDYFDNEFEGHYISPSQELKDELIELCFELINKEVSAQKRLIIFFRMWHILINGAESTAAHGHNIPEELVRIFDYINEHISENIRISDMAKELYISERTIERRFNEYIHIGALEFVRRKKLMYAANLLLQGSSVLNAGISAGYCDNSHFIKLFKEQYGVTPHKFKKQNFLNRGTKEAPTAK